jgi:hypothetical protein
MKSRLEGARAMTLVPAMDAAALRGFRHRNLMGQLPPREVSVRAELVWAGMPI